jgi:hypothetical protein
MTTTLIDPEAIPLTNAAFRDWMGTAGHKLEELDQKHYDILTDYFVNGNDEAAERQRDAQIHNLKWDLIGLKIAMRATYALWKQLRAEMN